MKSLLFFSIFFFLYGQCAQAQTQSFTQHPSSKDNHNGIFGNYNDAASTAIKILTVSGRGNKSHHSIEMLAQEIANIDLS